MLNSKLYRYLYKLNNKHNIKSPIWKDFYYTNLLYYPFIRVIKRKAYKDNSKFLFVDKSYELCKDIMDYIDYYSLH